MHPLYLMFSKSLSTSFLPSIWKMSFVTPVHKYGDKYNITKFRPTSILSIILNIFEALITKMLILIISPCIYSNQHGFRSNRSISTNLLLYQSNILSSFNNHVRIDSICINFQKVFVKVNLKLLLMKLTTFGFSG